MLSLQQNWLNIETINLAVARKPRDTTCYLGTYYLGVFLNEKPSIVA